MVSPTELPPEASPPRITPSSFEKISFTIVGTAPGIPPGVTIRRFGLTYNDIIITIHGLFFRETGCGKGNISYLS